MTSALDLSTLDADALRVLASRLMSEMRGKQVLIDKHAHEMANVQELGASSVDGPGTGKVGAHRSGLRQAGSDELGRCWKTGHSQFDNGPMRTQRYRPWRAGLKCCTRPSAPRSNRNKQVQHVITTTSETQL
jgi:hypothetical protein